MHTSKKINKEINNVLQLVSRTFGKKDAGAAVL